MKSKAYENIFLIAFSLFIFTSILMYSTLNLSRNFLYIARIFLLVTVLFIEMQKKNQKVLHLIVFFLFLGLSCVAKFRNGQWNILDIGILIIGAKNVRFIDIVKVYRMTSIVALLIILSLFACGIIDENLYFRRDIARHSFGFIYATDLVALIFYILLSDFYIIQNKSKQRTISNFFHYFIYFILGISVYFVCDARLGTICILLLIPANFYLKHLKKRASKLERFILVNSVPFFALLTLLLTELYILLPRSIILEKIDAPLSFRLYYSKMGVLIYGYTLFGQKIEMRGAGSSDYFFIDSSYMNIALVYGILVLVVICVLFSMTARKQMKKGSPILPLVFLIIAINSFVGQQMIDIAYDVFLLSFFSIKNDEKYFLKRSAYEHILL